MNLHDLLQQSASTWIAQERANAQSLPGQVVRHITAAGKLRQPQREAIEVYLWLKFVGKNASLGDLIRNGTLADTIPDEDRIRDNPIQNFLHHFAKANALKDLTALVCKEWHGKEAGWNRFLDDLLHNFNYPLYLYSLPMGAGKTYLMAAVIHLDLHFARLHPGDPRFARNFVVFAPQASKTAILPSLQTIRNFDPAWVLPPSDAAELRRIVHFEILDSLSSARRDKLHGNNPDLEKVNRLTQTRDFGLVFITNAEKVVMEKLEDSDATYTIPESPFYDLEKATALRKVNDLREKLSRIPGISIILDEAHHFFSSTGDDEKKLKLAVDVLNQHGHVCTVHGFNARRGKKARQDMHEGDEEEKAEALKTRSPPVTISESGLELIEAIQFDTTLRKDGVWISNPELEDKAGVRQRVKGTYMLPTNKFRMKVRNIAGDEIVMDSQAPA